MSICMRGWPAGHWRQAVTGSRRRRVSCFRCSLSRVFRGKFVAGLEALRSADRLAGLVATLADWQRLRQRLHVHDGVVYAKQPLGGPDAVPDYLGRYTHRVAISNERIVGIEGNDVLFRVRADPASGKKRTLRVPGAEFFDRFLQQVLPAGFKRIQHYGLLSPARKKDALATARAALDVPPPQAAVIESVAEFMQRVAHMEHTRCPHCKIGQFRVVASLLPQRDLVHPRRPP